MKHYRIAERYANGLNKALENDEDLEPAARALTALRRLYESHDDLRSALSNPSINLEIRLAVLGQLLDRLETPPCVRRLAGIMLRRGRIAMLPGVARIFAAKVDERLNRAGARIVSAVELTPEQSARVVAALERYSGRTIRADLEVDPGILGGIVAEIGGALIDGSVRTRLRRLRHALVAEESLEA